MASITRPSRPEQHRASRNPENTLWIQHQKLRVFLSHLLAWSLHHDSSNYFHGSINVSDPTQQRNLELGKTVVCTVSSTSGNISKRIAVRLFGPQEDGSYRLIVREGAGWVTARQYLDREYFKNLQQHCLESITIRKNLTITPPSRTVVPTSTAENRNQVTFRPLFRHFCSLPVELQEKVLAFAFNKSGHWSFPPTPQRRRIRVLGQAVFFEVAPLEPQRISSMLRISNAMNAYLVPWVYSTIDFHFRLVKLTSFMYQAGPANRKLIRKLTFAFGFRGLPHCVQWFSPDAIFKLFDPDIKTNPGGMGYFWRCQLQDLVRELHLERLTIDICDMPSEDIRFVTALLRQAFGSIECIRFTDRQTVIPLDNYELHLYNAQETWTWKQLCSDAFMRYRDDPWFRGILGGGRRKALSAEQLHQEMDSVAFFDSVPQATWYSHPRTRQ